MNKKAFTLVELLAVIIILGTLSVLIIPKVASSLKESEKKTNLASAQNLVKAAELKAANNEVQGKAENKKISYTNNENIDYLDYSGEKPEKGQVNIKSNGKVAMAVKIGDNCYLKSYTSSDITVIPYNENTCNENADVLTNYERPDLAISGDGLYEAQGEPERYVYRGADPDNYIWLDENADGTKASTEIYRIISYEPDDTIKVIRNTSIGDKEWDKSTSTSAGPRHNADNTYCNYTGTYYGCNVWATQGTTYYNDTTLTALNQDFYFKYFPNNTTQTFQNHSNAGTVTKNASLNEYLNHLIENEDYWTPAEVLDKYIANHSFNVGGINYTFNYTGGDKGLEKEKNEQNVYTWNGKIGLMNITEYVEASLNPTCTSVYSNFYFNENFYPDKNRSNTHNTMSYDDYPCSNRNYNWIPKAISEWTLAASSNYKYVVWLVNSSGPFNYYGVPGNANGVRPSFYLKSSVKLGGFGTSSEPYYIVES